MILNDVDEWLKYNVSVTETGTITGYNPDNTPIYGTSVKYQGPAAVWEASASERYKYQRTGFDLKYNVIIRPDLVAEEIVSGDKLQLNGETYTIEVEGSNILGLDEVIYFKAGIKNV